MRRTREEVRPLSVTVDLRIGRDEARWTITSEYANPDSSEVLNAVYVGVRPAEGKLLSRRVTIRHAPFVEVVTRTDIVLTAGELDRQALPPIQPGAHVKVQEYLAAPLEPENRLICLFARNDSGRLMVVTDGTYVLPSGWDPSRRTARFTVKLDECRVPAKVTVAHHEAVVSGSKAAPGVFHFQQTEDLEYGWPPGFRVYVDSTIQAVSRASASGTEVASAANDARG